MSLREAVATQHLLLNHIQPCIHLWLCEPPRAPGKLFDIRAACWSELSYVRDFATAKMFFFYTIMVRIMMNDEMKTAMNEMG